METWSDRIAALSFAQILLILLALTAARFPLRRRRAAFFVFAYELTGSALKAVAFVFLLARPFLVQTYHIPTRSMLPRLQVGDAILVNKWAFRGGLPACGEVVVFRAPDGSEKETIKRVVGLPGDALSVTPGAVVLVGADKRTRRYDHQAIRQALGLTRDASLRLTESGIWVDGERVAPEELARRAGREGDLPAIEPGVLTRNGVALKETYLAEDLDYELPLTVVPTGHVFVLGDNRNLSQDSHDWGPLPMERLVGRAEAIWWPMARVGRIR